MKKKVIKDYRNLPEDIRNAIREVYPHGYMQDVVTFFNKDKQLVSALPYETDEISYLIKMPSSFYLDEEESKTTPIESIPEGELMEDLDEEKYLLQEEEEEESD